MGLSGAFTGSTGNQYIFPTIKWSATQDLEGNYSDVTATLYYSRSNSGYTTSGTWSGGITINGIRTAGSRHIEVFYQSGTLAISATTRVYHNADGTKDVTISADGAISGTSLSSTTISATVTLDTIPRASAISVPSLTMGKAGAITITPAASGFRHTLRYVFGTASGTISTKTAATSVNWTPPKDLATQIPTNTVGIGRVYCDTYSGDTLIGTTSQQVYITVSDDAVPTISTFTVAEATAGIASKFGAYVQNKSTLKVSIKSSGVYGSTVTKCETTIQSVIYRESSFTSGVITESGTISVVTVITDSRGRTTKSTKNITVLPYSPPAINSFFAYRITSSGAASDDGNRLAVTMAYTIASVGGKNDRAYKLLYKKSGDENFAQFDGGTADESYDGTANFTDAPDVSTDYAYIVRLELTDYFQTVAYEVQLPTAFTIMDFRSTGRGMAIGKVSEKDALEVAMDAEFTGDVEFSGDVMVNNKTLLDWLHPIGSIYQSTVETDPGELFGGVWEQLKDRFLLAAGDSYTAGASGGEASHTLTQEELPAAVWTSGSGTGGVETSTSGAAGTGYGMRTQATNWGKAHNNMPPYVVVYMWKRTA